MHSCNKSVDPVVRSRNMLIGLFGAMLIQLVLQPAFTYYWLRENNGPALAPNEDYRLSWMPDEDFRGLDATRGATYEVTQGDRHTSYQAGETWQWLRPYYVASPDGRWHAQVLAKGPFGPHAMRAYVFAVAMPVVFALIGMIVCIYGLPSGASDKSLE